MPCSDLPPCAELAARALELGRKCKDGHSELLEVMLLISRIQGLMEGDPGFRHARQIAARLGDPPWENLTAQDRELLNQAADAIARACKLGKRVPAANGVSAPFPRDLVRGGVIACGRGDLTPEQIERITSVVVGVIEDASRTRH